MATVRVTLAMPHDGKAADTTVEMDRAVGLDLVHTGRARLAEETKATPTPKTSAAKAEGN